VSPSAISTRAVPNIAVLDPSADRQVLLTATLRVLGCRVHPIDCSGQHPDDLARQLSVGGPFQVVVWDVSQPAQSHAPSAMPTPDGIAAFGRSGVIVAASDAKEAEDIAGHLNDQARVLLKPFTTVALMAAVRAAASWSENETALLRA
jgi:hypothetical protein